ncbi:hypothetical protein CU097_009393 [Rhizopus azygosporus]|uniref:Uncharacterized protein n=1 Tax=Rhizopus azygosporus TaxID=86630 RepID=A0A367JFL7_RHIAZ|nr:hypothetical protein CU097_009393 [Rhizopus azygosporus]
MQPIYKAFDHFGFSPDFSSLSLANILLLPLANLFLSIPDFCHLRVLTSNFFIIDDATERLRLRVRKQYDCSCSSGTLFCKTYHISQKIKLLIPLYCHFNNNRCGNNSPPFNLDGSQTTSFYAKIPHSCVSPQDVLESGYATTSADSVV